MKRTVEITCPSRLLRSVRLIAYLRLCLLFIATKTSLQEAIFIFYDEFSVKTKCQNQSSNFDVSIEDEGEEIRAVNFK